MKSIKKEEIGDDKGRGINDEMGAIASLREDLRKRVVALEEEFAKI